MMKNKIITYIIFCLCTFTTFGQMQHSVNKSLSIGGEPDLNYGLTIHNAKGLNLYGNSLFLVDVEHTFCYMRGLGWGVYFYDPDTETYNDICVQSVLLRANGEFYDSWIDDDSDPSMLRQLNPVTYNFRNSIANKQGDVQKEDASSQHIVFLAQEVECVVPSAVTTDDEGRKYVNYNAILPIAVKSIRTIAKKSESNRHRLEKIRTAIGSLTTNKIAP